MGLFLYLLLSLCFLGKLFSFSLSSQDANRIGEKIWTNECSASLEGLTSWNKGEHFASMGIGHFIWYPVDKKERFQETFPALLKFLQKQGATLPLWLKGIQGCPWNSREEFYKNIQSLEMKLLRQFLFDTKQLQATFIVNRLENSFLQIIEQYSQEEKDQITTTFLHIAEETNGLYALIDYLNFKGAGTSSKETYKGHGWGLLQVLQQIPAASKKPPLIDFVQAAKIILKQRVQNAPPERHEEQWLKGWFNRLDGYKI